MKLSLLDEVSLLKQIGVKEPQLGGVSLLKQIGVKEPQLGAVKEPQLGAVKESQLGGVKESQLGGVKESQLGGVKESQLGGVKVPQLGVVKESQLGGVKESQLGAVKVPQLGVVKESQLGGVKESQLGAVKESQLGGVKESQLGAVNESQQRINCPICQKSVTIPVGGVKDIPQDLHLGNEVKIAQYQTKVASKDAVPCDICIDSTSSGPAVGFCCSCHHFMCRQCCEYHKRARNFYQHDVIVLGEAVPKKRLSAVKPTCALHSKELVFYCVTCCCLICHDCTTSDHNEHIQSAILPSIASSSFRQEIHQLLPSAQVVMSKLTGAVDRNVKIMKEVEDNEETDSQIIKQTFLQLHQALDDRMSKLLTDLHDIAIYKKTALMLQKEEFERLEQDLSRCVEFTSNMLQKYTDCEIIALKQIPSTGIRVCTSRARSVSFEPCECSDIKLLLNTHLFHTSLPNVCHLDNVCPGKSTWNSSAVSPTKGSPFRITVEAKDYNEQEYPFDDTQLEVVLNPALGGSAVLGKVSKCRKGKYSIVLTPVNSGMHLLSITMNGQHVKNSPHYINIENASDSM
eukprot:Em0002g1610a